MPRTGFSVKERKERIRIKVDKISSQIAPAQDWTPPSPQPGGPNLLKSLPPELRNKIYDLALPTGEGGDVAILTRFFEPSLLFMCNDIRAEAGGLWYGTRAFGLRLPRKPKDMAGMVRKLRSIVARDDPRALTKGIIFYPQDAQDAEIAENLRQLMPLLDFVQQTGAVLLPQSIIPGSLLTKANKYASYQTTRYQKDMGKSVIQLLLLGLTAREQGWSRRLLSREASELAVAMTKGTARGRREGAPASELVVTSIAGISFVVSLTSS